MRSALGRLRNRARDSAATCSASPRIDPAVRPNVVRMADLSNAGNPVGGPAQRAWREGTLTRAKELESLTVWAAAACTPDSDRAAMVEAIGVHLAAARQAATTRQRFGDKAALERAISNLDAAETALLNIAPVDYLVSRFPGVVNDAERHLSPTDFRRQHVEELARRIALADSLPVDLARPGATRATAQEAAPPAVEAAPRPAQAILDAERLTIAAVNRAAASGALREQLRVRSFRNVLIVTSALLTVLAAALILLGLLSPTAIPLCFAPEEAGQAMVVCPTAQSSPFPTDRTADSPATELRDVDDAVLDTVRPVDVLLVAVLGLAAAAVAAAAAIRGMRGSSEPHGLPVAVAVLKLPMGAVTAILGVLLMRGQFVPGLSALDTSAQILAWALVFGYAQQLFTRLVDQQAHTVLGSVRGGGDRARPRELDPAR
jgi:hypothetical protein